LKEEHFVNLPRHRGQTDSFATQAAERAAKFAQAIFIIGVAELADRGIDMLLDTQAHHAPTLSL
jgi:hypothetical protein